jgi:polyvinyl alcohol dehydrogenase (cytochrome)
VIVGSDVLNHAGPRAGVWALDVRSGRVRWRFDAEAGRPARGCGDVWSSPAVDVARRTVYVGTGSCNRPRRGWTPYTEALVALDLDSGRPRWAFQPHRPSNHDLDFAGRPNLFWARGRPLVGIGGKDGLYYALTGSGTLVWKRRLTRPDPQPGNVSGIIAPAAVSGSTIVVGSFGDAPTVHALDAAAGRIRWKADGAPVYGSPTIRGGTVYVGDTGGALTALGLATGARLWHTRLPGGIAGATTAAGDTLLVPYGYRIPGSGANTPRTGIAAYALR